MNTTNAMILSGVFAIAGQWTRHKPLTLRVGVGVAFAAIGLSAISSVDTKLGQDFAVLILLASILYNGPEVFKAVGKATAS